MPRGNRRHFQRTRGQSQVEKELERVCRSRRSSELLRLVTRYGGGGRRKGDWPQWLARKRHRIIRCLWKQQRASFSIGTTSCNNERPERTRFAFRDIDASLTFASASPNTDNWIVRSWKSEREGIRPVEFPWDLCCLVRFLLDGWFSFLGCAHFRCGSAAERNKRRMMCILEFSTRFWKIQSPGCVVGFGRTKCKFCFEYRYWQFWQRTEVELKVEWLIEL